MKRDFLQQSIKKSIAAGLIFWLTGVVFLFCCQMPTMAAQAEKDSCPLAKTSHCNKKLNGSSISEFVSLETKNPAFNCCILPSIFDKARKVEPLPQIAGIAPALKIIAPEFSAVKNEFAFLPIYRPPVLSRHETYLKNRVFRI